MTTGVQKEPQEPYDLLIIGGGINGAGIARDAAGRGLSVLLVEAEDLASHTSSASTKLIHGGLRYLEYYEFRLVRESLIERERPALVALVHAETSTGVQQPLARVAAAATPTRAGTCAVCVPGAHESQTNTQGMTLKDSPTTPGLAWARAWRQPNDVSRT
jgi:glycerol-3-phosphate dehydrogenase